MSSSLHAGLVRGSLCGVVYVPISHAQVIIGQPSRIYDVGSQVLDANATLVSLVMETLASLAEACGPRFGEAFLSRALYPLLEKVSPAA